MICPKCKTQTIEREGSNYRCFSCGGLFARKKKKRDILKLSIIAILIIGSIFVYYQFRNIQDEFNTTLIGIENKFDELQKNYNDLVTEHNNLIINYEILKNSSELNKTLFQRNIDNLIVENNKLGLDISSVLEKNNSLQNEILALSNDNKALEQEIANLNNRLSGILPYGKANGDLLTLSNNFGGTHNPTLRELKTFLRRDDTETILYKYGTFVCGDFAERLHNNAEKVGIRAGIVVVQFLSGPGHVFNVFYTTDAGTIYIDCTGFQDTYSKAEDTVVYALLGRELGKVDLDVVYSFSYSFYTNYEDRVNDYIQKVNQYNSGLGGYSGEELRQIATTLGDNFYQPMGIVRELTIYW